MRPLPRRWLRQAGAAIDARERGDRVELLKPVEATERARVRVNDSHDRRADRGDMAEMLRHVEAMEQASVRVIDSLDRMADSVA